MTKPQEVNPQAVAKIRELAQSILAAVTELEDTNLHPSWDGQEDRAEEYLAETLELLTKADSEVWSTIDSFSDEFLP